MRTVRLRWTMVLVMILALAGLQGAVANEPASKLAGKILGPGGQPLSGVQVVVYHLSTEQVFTSSPTDGGGKYELTNLPHGYFDVAVQTTDGLFVTDQVVNVPFQGKATLSMTVETAAAGTTTTARQFPGVDQPAVGVAKANSHAGGFKNFLRGPAGTAVIAGGGALTLLAIAGSDSSDSSSPSTP